MQEFQKALDALSASLNPGGLEDRGTALAGVLDRYAKRGWKGIDYLWLGLREHKRLLGTYPARHCLAAWLYHAWEPGDGGLSSVAFLKDCRSLGFSLEEAERHVVPLISGCWDLTGGASVVIDMELCQPPGTQVTVLNSPKRGSTRATYRRCSIESLPEDGVISWRRSNLRAYSAPNRVKVSSRWYKGPLITIKAKNGSSTKVTPRHWLWVRFNTDAQERYILYLMHHRVYGYRVGVTRFKIKGGNDGKSGFGLSNRASSEHADGAWILKVFSTKAEAEAWEEIYSLKYGIPQCVFNASYAGAKKTQELVKLIFSHASQDGALRCLEEHGMFPDAPILDLETLRCKDWRGYFKTPAANVAPLGGMLFIPVQGSNKHTLVQDVSTEAYEGLVYSLDVENDHTYIADGLVVGNSLYGQPRVAYLRSARRARDRWRHLGSRAWEEGRTLGLVMLVQKDPMFQSPEFERELAAAARANIKAELLLLGLDYDRERAEADKAAAEAKEKKDEVPAQRPDSAPAGKQGEDTGPVPGGGEGGGEVRVPPGGKP